MIKQTKQATVRQEESPDSIAEYHDGADNSIKKVMRSIQGEKARQGIAMEGVDEKDYDEIKEPYSDKKEIKSPPKAPR